MASPRLTLLLSVLAAVVLISSAASSFDESNPIRLASEGLRELQDQFVQVLGHVCHVHSFARFAFRWVLCRRHCSVTALSQFDLCDRLKLTGFGCVGMRRSTRAWRRWGGDSRFSPRTRSWFDPPTGRACLTSSVSTVSQLLFIFCLFNLFILCLIGRVNLRFRVLIVVYVGNLVTGFADWTWEEFQRHRLGAAQNCSATTKGNHKLTDAVPPLSVILKLFLNHL